MPVARCSGWAVLALVSGGCAPHHADVGAPALGFATVADALGCARNALADAGFHAETGIEAPPGQRSPADPVETPTSVTARLVSGPQIEYVGARAHARRGPQGESTVTLTVSAGTLVTEGPNAAATMRPLSSLAAQGRDAVVTQCHAAIERGTYPRSS
jgi:hypothetical protein